MNDYNQRHILGLPEMDEQHNYLYSLFDRVENKTTVSDHVKTGILFAEIERYVSFHFESEEYLMRTYNYVGFAAHQSDHEIAGSKLIQFLDDFDAQRLNPVALRIFLTGWLMEHSKISDSAYTLWIKEQRSLIQ